MILKHIFNVFIIFSVCFSISFAIDFKRFYAINGVPQPIPPLPTQKAGECLKTISDKLFECKDNSIKNWNITDYSSLADACCSQWDLLDCTSDYVATSQCNGEQLDEVNYYIEDLSDFYNANTCEAFPRGSTHCVLPILPTLEHDEPPPPSPLALDCLSNLKMEVRLGCFKMAQQKWNITHKKGPLRNICCAAWDDVDCLDEIINIRCPSSEIPDTEDYFNKVKTWAEKIACSAYPYHSQNCSTGTTTTPYITTSTPGPYKGRLSAIRRVPEPKPLITIEEVEEPNNDLIFPAKFNKAPENSAPLGEMDNDYKDFLMNYILTVFPHLLNLMVLLAMILVAVIVMQCFIIGRQIKRDRIAAGVSPIYHKGYHKLNVQKMNKYDRV